MPMFQIRRFDKVASTNEIIKQALEAGEPEGLVCRARSQTGGHGRQGRLWTSPVGGLYQSLLLRPTVDIAQLPTLGLVVGCAIRSALVELGGLSQERIQLKWPNDIMAGHSKLAGISLETHAGGVCVGIGVNVFRPAEECIADGKYAPAYYADLMMGYTEQGTITFGDGEPIANEQAAIDLVGYAVLKALETDYIRWLDQGFAALVDEYRACSYLQGRRVRMSILNGTPIVEGVVVGVDDAGLLLVDDGEQVQHVSSGEAHIL